MFWQKGLVNEWFDHNIFVFEICTFTGKRDDFETNFDNLNFSYKISFLFMQAEEKIKLVKMN